MNKKTLKIVIPILLALIGFYFSEQSISIPTPTQFPTATSSVASAAASHTEIQVETPVLRTYTVTKVVDGDTIAVLMDGKKVTIRLIGMDTPETVDPRKPVQCFGIEASNKAKELLTGQTVGIEQDYSQDTYDKYGRLLAYVYLPSGMMFNEYMIAEGYAHEYTYRTPYKYQNEFKAAEEQARSGKKGFWADTPDGGCSGITN